MKTVCRNTSFKEFTIRKKETMRLRIQFTVLVAIVFLVQGCGSSEPVYSENFQNDPEFELAFDPLSGESYQWSGDYGGSYFMRMKEYPTTFRFSLTPVFQLIENESFHIEVDYLPIDDNGEWGMGLGLLALEGENWENQSVAIYYNGTRQRFHFHDGSGATITTGTLQYGVWYSLSIDYNAQRRTADFRVTERDTGNEFFTEQDVDFNPGAFDRFCLGSKSVNSDGNWISLYCDNILLELK